MMVETGTFTVAAARHARAGVEAIIARWWWAFALPLAAGLALSLLDWRILLAVFCLLLVVYPGVLALAYYNCALSPDSARELVPHKYEFYADKIIIIYYKANEDGDAGKAEEVEVPVKNVVRAEESDRGFTLAYQGLDGIVRLADVPFSAFNDNADIQTVRAILKPYFEEEGQ